MRAIDFVFDQTVSSMRVSLLELCSESGQDLRRKNESKEWEGGWGIRKEGGNTDREREEEKADGQRLFLQNVHIISGILRS